MSDFVKPRQSLLLWGLWFSLGNAILFWLIGLHYFPIFSQNLAILSEHNKVIATGFTVVAYLSQLALLAFIPSLITLPLIIFFPVKKLVFSFSIVIASTAALLLILDTITYSLYRFHLNGIMSEVILGGLLEKNFSFSLTEYIYFFALTAGLVIIEYWYATKLCQIVTARPKWLSWGKWAVFSLTFCAYLAYSIMIFSLDNKFINKILMDATRFLPLYHTLLGKLGFSNTGIILLKNKGQSYVVPLPQPNSPLHYPLHASATLTKNPMNIVIIVIDAWRFDMLNAEVTPHLFNFANKAWTFKQHFSGGNATAPGIFSIFYSMPSTYWAAMEAQHRGPVLIDELLKYQYQMGIFSSASLKLPDFSQTVFRAIRPLQLHTPGKTAYERDTAITQQFLHFLFYAHQQKKPFFSFVFYDAAHAYCDFDQNIKPFQPAIKHCERFLLTNSSDPKPYLNRYKNALRLVDEQIQQIIGALESKHLLSNTIVIITGDHGEEFNDNHLGYWGHASNFTHYQVQTPLIIHWPNSNAQTFTHRTSHFDIVPTLMKQLFTYPYATTDYSMGIHLLDKRLRPYLIVGSYTDFSILEFDQITTITPDGQFKVELINGRSDLYAKLDNQNLQNVFKDLSRFYEN